MHKNVKNKENKKKIVKKTNRIIYQLLLGRPFPLQNCSITNQSADSLQVDCIEGFDGGLPQSFMLELVELNNLRLARNITLQVSLSTSP